MNWVWGGIFLIIFQKHLLGKGVSLLKFEFSWTWVEALPKGGRDERRRGVWRMGCGLLGPADPSGGIGLVFHGCTLLRFFLSVPSHSFSPTFGIFSLPLWEYRYYHPLPSSASLPETHHRRSTWRRQRPPSQSIEG